MPTSQGEGRPSERRRSARTRVVWEALQGVLSAVDGEARIVDIGGGTGGFAVPLAEQGHRVRVVDPSPDALAALARRADEQGVTDRITGQQGDLTTLAELVGSDGEVDLVLCHGVLEMVDDPAAALAAVAGVLRPGGFLSLLVAQRYASVVARAMAGHFVSARELLDRTEADARTGRRYTSGEITALLLEAGLEPGPVQGVRVFADLVPGSLHDLEPGGVQALFDLEGAVATRPEFLPLATQVHVLARR